MPKIKQLKNLTIDQAEMIDRIIIDCKDQMTVKNDTELAWDALNRLSKLHYKKRHFCLREYSQRSSIRKFFDRVTTILEDTTDKLSDKSFKYLSYHLLRTIADSSSDAITSSHTNFMKWISFTACNFFDEKSGNDILIVNNEKLQVKNILSNNIFDYFFVSYIIDTHLGVKYSDHEKEIFNALYDFLKNAQFIAEVINEEQQREVRILPNLSKLKTIDVTDYSARNEKEFAPFQKEYSYRFNNRGRIIHSPDFKFHRSLLHADGETAIEWCDRKYYYCRGFLIHEELGSVHSSNWNIRDVLKVSNADQRVALIETMGLQKLIDRATIIDTYKNHTDDQNYHWFEKSEYKLVDMKKYLDTRRPAPYLVMKNQTTGDIHVEGVKPSCKTIKDALSDRDGVDYNKSNIIIDEIH